MNNYNVVSVSGGKDSTATLLLAIDRGAENLQAVFADTGHEHQAVYDYLEYLEQATGVKIRRVRADFAARIAGRREYIKQYWPIEGIDSAVIDRALEIMQPSGNPFLDLCLWKGRFPSSQSRFCTEHLKRDPIIEQVFVPLLDDPQTSDVFSWQGVRADESPKRALLPESDEVGNGLFNYRPILTWTAAEVFAFHTKHGIRWNPLYEQGMSRVGCMSCVNCRKEELQEIAKRFPAEIERVAEWERLVSQASHRGSSTLFTTSKDPTTGNDVVNYETHGIVRTVEWSKTTRGGRQFDLLALMGGDTGCSSAYGLCDIPRDAA